MPCREAAGEIAFVANLNGGDTTSSNASGIFTSSSLVARRGDAAPGTDGASFFGIGSPRLNASGEIAFGASLTGGDTTFDNNGGIFTSSSLVARRGVAAPGTNGAIFSDFGVFSLNDFGEIAFSAVLTGGDTTTSSNRGIFIADAFGYLYNVLRLGDEFYVGDNDLRTIASIELGPEGFKDDVLAFRLVFSDFTAGIFTATIDRGQIVPIPLPASAWLMLLAIGFYGVAARQRRAA